MHCLFNYYHLSFQFANIFGAISKPQHWNLSIHWNWNWNWNWHYKRHYFQFDKAYGPQTWQGHDLGWGDLIHKVTWHLDIVVKWQIKNIRSPFPQDLWTPNLAGWWLRMREPHPQSHVSHQLCGHVTSRKLYISTFTRPTTPKTW